MITAQFTYEEAIVFNMLQALSPTVISLYKKMGFNNDGDIKIVDKYMGLTALNLGMSFFINQKSNNIYAAFPQITLICYGMVVKMTNDKKLIDAFQGFAAQQSLSNAINFQQELGKYIQTEIPKDIIQRITQNIPNIPNFLTNQIQQLGSNNVS